MLRNGRITIIEPSLGSFIHTLFVLVEELCHAATTDPRSARCWFAFSHWEIVEPVRQMLMTTERVVWREHDPTILTKTGHVVTAGPHVAGDWSWARVVVVCSGAYPTSAVMEALENADEITFVFDPQDPPRTAPWLRTMARDLVVTGPHRRCLRPRK